MTAKLIVEKLHQAAGGGDLAEVNALLNQHPGLIDETSGPGVRTALHQAVFGQQETAVKLLLERGADPNIRCEGDNATPLHFAAEKQLFRIVRMLVEYGADPVGEGDYHELEVIGWATAWESIKAKPKMVQYLIDHGARHNIFSAVAMGEVETIKEIVSRSRADLDRRMDMANRRRRPLHLAIIKKQLGSFQALLELGANLESLDEAGFSALDEAAMRGEKAMAQLLLDRGAKVRLPAAIALKRTADIQRILKRDPEVLKPGQRWGLLIIRASERASGATIATLIGAGASVDVRDDPKTAVDSALNFTALHAAAFHGNKSAAKALLKHGANVQIREQRYHGTPAGWADYAGHKKVRDLILAHAVDMIEAAQYGLIERAKVILHEDAAALNRPFKEYKIFPLQAEGWFTPLDFAAHLGNQEMVQFLRKQGGKSGSSKTD